MENKNIFQTECYEIVGACTEVHKTLGCGFLEGVYQEALEFEFGKRKIPFERKKELVIYYKDIELQKKYNADFVCYEKIIIKLKACSKLLDEHISQVLNYLNATNFKLVILVNFGEKSLKFKRIVL